MTLSLLPSQSPSINSPGCLPKVVVFHCVCVFAWSLCINGLYGVSTAKTWTLSTSNHITANKVPKQQRRRRRQWRQLNSTNVVVLNGANKRYVRAQRTHTCNTCNDQFSFLFFDLFIYFISHSKNISLNHTNEFCCCCWSFRRRRRRRRRHCRRSLGSLHVSMYGTTQLSCERVVVVVVCSS